MDMTNCPNCGAPVIGRRCEYCETVFSESITEEDELTEAVSAYYDSLDAWENDYKRMLLGLHTLADERSRFDKWFAWSDVIVIIFVIIFGLSVVLGMY